MKQELALPKYKNMKLVKIVYGNDESGDGADGSSGPALGLSQPARHHLADHGRHSRSRRSTSTLTKSLLKTLTLTGLGLPSQMKKYVMDGTVKQFELWNPGNLGYLAGYAAANLASGVKLQAGQSFTAGTLGKYKILPPAAGTGLSVVLGPPTVFDKSNVGKFNF